MRSPHWQYKAQSSANMTVPTTTTIGIRICVALLLGEGTFSRDFVAMRAADYATLPSAPW